MVFILTCSFYFFIVSVNLGQNKLGFSIDLYNQLLKIVDHNNDGVLDETEIEYVCSLSLKKCNSIKGISKLKKLKNLTLEMNDCDITEIFELENIKKLTLKSLHTKKPIKIPANCKFRHDLIFLSLNNFKINTYDIKIKSLQEVSIENCDIIDDVNKLFEISDLLKLSVSYSNIKEDLKILSTNPKLKELSFRKTVFSSSTNSYDKLINLEYLTISDCNLTEFPNSIIELKKLISLDLSRNNFESFPESILKMQQLTLLYLFNNNRKLKLPKEIDKMDELTNIPIEIGCKNGIDQEIFKIKKLGSLYLNNCDLEEIPEKIFEMDYLEYLFLTNNKIKYLPQNLKTMKSLKSLNLSFNKINEVPKWIEEMKTLETLNLSNNEIAIVNLNGDRLLKLKELSLENNKISQFPNQLASSKNLNRIDLSYNKISYVEDLKYGDFASFSRINLESNPINKLPGFLKEVVSLGYEKNLNKYDDDKGLNDLEEPYNLRNIIEEILTAQNNTVIVHCEIKEKLKSHSKNIYLAEIKNCIIGTCGVITIKINANVPLTLNEEYIISGTLDDDNELYCYIGPQSNNTARSFDDIENNYPKGKIIFSLIEQWMQYTKNKHSGKVKFEYDNKLYAEGVLKNGMPEGEWIIFFSHPEANQYVKASLKYEGTKLHGEQNFYSFKKGFFNKNFHEYYYKGKLIKKENFVYNNNSTHAINGEMFSEKNGQYYKKVYELNNKLDTLFFRNYLYYDSFERIGNGGGGTTYIGNIDHGVFRKYEQDRLIYEANYHFGQKIGLLYQKDKCCCDTMAIYKNTDKKNKPKDVLAFHENGKVRISGEINKGRKAGIWTFYDKKGEVEKVHRYKNDVLHGELEYYNGIYKIIRTYENGIVKKEEKFVR